MSFRLKSLAAVLAAALLAAACDDTSLGPGLVAVSSNGSIVGAGQVLVTVSSATVQATTPVLVSATILQNGATVADGTQVRFVTNLGSFSDSSSPITMETTASGIAAVSFTSLTTGVATVTVSVNGASGLATVVFSQPPGM
jgi:hypothetical protein